MTASLDVSDDPKRQSPLLAFEDDLLNTSIDRQRVSRDIAIHDWAMSQAWKLDVIAEVAAHNDILNGFRDALWQNVESYMELQVSSLYGSLHNRLPTRDELADIISLVSQTRLN